MTEKMEIATTKQSRMFQPSAKYASFVPYNPKENIFRSISAENIAVIQISIEYKMNDELEFGSSSGESMISKMQDRRIIVRMNPSKIHAPVLLLLSSSPTSQILLQNF